MHHAQHDLAQRSSDLSLGSRGDVIRPTHTSVDAGAVSFDLCAPHSEQRPCLKAKTRDSGDGVQSGDTATVRNRDEWTMTRMNGGQGRGRVWEDGGVKIREASPAGRAMDNEGPRMYDGAGRGLGCPRGKGVPLLQIGACLQHLNACHCSPHELPSTPTRVRCGCASMLPGVSTVIVSIGPGHAVCLARRYTFNKPRMRCILHDGDSKDTRLVLLAEELAQTGAGTA